MPKIASVYEDIVEDYLVAHGLSECELADAIRWGIRTGRLAMSPQSQLSYHMPLARRALREKKFVTPSGKRVREWHHYRVQAPTPTGGMTQKDFWSNIQTWSSQPNGDVAMLESLKERCKAAKVDVQQIKKDRDGFNELRSALGLPGVQLRLAFSYS